MQYRVPYHRGSALPRYHSSSLDCFRGYVRIQLSAGHSPKLLTFPQLLWFLTRCLIRSKMLHGYLHDAARAEFTQTLTPTFHPWKLRGLLLLSR